MQLSTLNWFSLLFFSPRICNAADLCDATDTTGESCAADAMSLIQTSLQHKTKLQHRSGSRGRLIREHYTKTDFQKRMQSAKTKDKMKFDLCEVSSGAELRCLVHKCDGDSSKNQVNLHGHISRFNSASMPVISGNSEGSYCAISHEYQFIFLHVLKNAGSNTKGWLIGALCSGDEEECDPQVLSLDVCYGLLQSYPNYLRWTWTRGVASRAISIYGMAKQYEMPNVSPEEFWLNEDRWSLTGLSPDHARPQTEFLEDGSGCLSVDFLGSLENAETDLKTLIDLLDAPPLRSHYDKNGFAKPHDDENDFGSEVTKEEHESARKLVNSNQTMKDMLYQLFQDDVDLIGW